MGMTITGIPCVQWDFYGNGNGNVDRTGVGMNVIEIILALSQWHSHCHRFISNFTHCQLLTAFCFCTAMLSSLSNTPCVKCDVNVSFTSLSLLPAAISTCLLSYTNAVKSMHTLFQ